MHSKIYQINLNWGGELVGDDIGHKYFWSRDTFTIVFQTHGANRIVCAR